MPVASGAGRGFSGVGSEGAEGGGAVPGVREGAMGAGGAAGPGSAAGGEGRGGPGAGATEPGSAAGGEGRGGPGAGGSAPVNWAVRGAGRGGPGAGGSAPVSWAVRGAGRGGGIFPSATSRAISTPRSVASRPQNRQMIALERILSPHHGQALVPLDLPAIAPSHLQS